MFSVSFTDTTTPTPTSWLWNFGDGQSSTEQNPTHEYAVDGDYKVTLDVDADFNPPASTTEQSIRHFTWPGQSIAPNYMHTYGLQVHPNTVDEYAVTSGDSLSFSTRYGVPFLYLNANNRGDYALLKLTKLGGVGDFLITFQTQNAATVFLDIGERLDSPGSHAYRIELRSEDFRILTHSPYEVYKYCKYTHVKNINIQAWHILIIGNRLRFREVPRDPAKQEPDGWLWDTTIDTTAHNTTLVTPDAGATLRVGANYWSPESGTVLANISLWLNPTESDVDGSYLPSTYSEPITETSWGSGVYSNYEESNYDWAANGKAPFTRSFVDGVWVARILGATGDYLRFPGLNFYQRNRANTVDFYFSHQAMNTSSRMILTLNHATTNNSSPPYVYSGHKFYFNDQNPTEIQQANADKSGNWVNYLYRDFDAKITDGVKRRFRIKSDNSSYIKMKAWPLGEEEPVAWSIEWDLHLSWGDGVGIWSLNTAYSNSTTDLRIWDIEYTKTDGATLKAIFSRTQTDLEVEFLNNTLGKTPSTSWSWDFGDTNSSTDENPTHVYASAGLYYVTLIATDPAGVATTKAIPIHVGGVSDYVDLTNFKTFPSWVVPNVNRTAPDFIPTAEGLYSMRVYEPSTPSLDIHGLDGVTDYRLDFKIKQNFDRGFTLYFGEDRKYALTVYSSRYWIKVDGGGSQNDTSSGPALIHNTWNFVRIEVRSDIIQIFGRRDNNSEWGPPRWVWTGITFSTANNSHDGRPIVLVFNPDNPSEHVSFAEIGITPISESGYEESLVYEDRFTGSAWEYGYPRLTSIWSWANGYVSHRKHESYGAGPAFGAYHPISAPYPVGPGYWPNPRTARDTRGVATIKFSMLNNTIDYWGEAGIGLRCNGNTSGYLFAIKAGYDNTGGGGGTVGRPFELIAYTSTGSTPATLTPLDTYVTGYTTYIDEGSLIYSPDFILKTEVVKDTVRAKMWLSSEEEPAGWQIELTDTTFTGAGWATIWGQSYGGFNTGINEGIWKDVKFFSADETS